MQRMQSDAGERARRAEAPAEQCVEVGVQQHERRGGA
jgi:hypothetical protein